MRDEEVFQPRFQLQSIPHEELAVRVLAPSFLKDVFDARTFLRTEELVLD